MEKVEAWAPLTDEANAASAWVVRRTKAPFCDARSHRIWSGPTAIKALRTAQAALPIRDCRTS